MDDKRPAVNLRSLAELFFANIEKRILTRYDLNFDPTLTLGREHLKDEVRAAIQAQDESYWNACTEELAKIIEHRSPLVTRQNIACLLGVFYVLGVAFKILHYPGAGIMLMVSMVGLSIDRSCGATVLFEIILSVLFQLLILIIIKKY